MAKFLPGSWVYYTKLGPSSLVQVVTEEEFDKAQQLKFFTGPRTVFYKTKRGNYNSADEGYFTPYDFGFENVLNGLDNETIKKEIKKMAKFTRIGFIGVPKKDAKKRYFKVDEKVAKITIDMVDGTKLQVKGEEFLQVFQPRQGKDQTDEAYEALLAWKKMELVHVSDSE